MNAAPTTGRPMAFASATGWAWLLTSFAAVILVAVGWPVLAAVHGVHAAVAMVLSVATAASLVLAVRWPRIGTVLGVAAALATALATAPVLGVPWPWPVTTLIAYLLLVLVVALRAPWRIAMATWIAGLLVSALAITVAAPADPSGAISNAIVCGGIGSGLVAVGSALRQLFLSRGQLRAQREVSAEQETQRRELQQRNRIAQELHDVVAHSMSVISVQATTAPYRLPQLDEDTTQEFASIAGSSRRALTEMRGLLAVLRGDDDPATAPQPGLADLLGLIESTRASGAAVGLTVVPADRGDDGRTGSVPPATGLTAYRIVQEAVSNALRHAPGAAVSVEVTVGEEAVELHVVNGPAEAAGAGSAPGSGLGLRGIRERAVVLGGTVHAGPTPDGGFAVHAHLPLG